MDPHGNEGIGSELLPKEELLWLGWPRRGTVFSSQDRLLIPLTLLWGGIAFGMEAAALGLTPFPKAPLWVALLGIPFIVLSGYLVVGRFVYRFWKKRNTWYAVTSMRVLVVEGGLRRRVTSAFHQPGLSVKKRKDSLVFGRLSYPAEALMHSGLDLFMNLARPGVVVFFELDEVDLVERLVLKRRDKGA